jgi:hypothetical protein
MPTPNTYRIETGQSPATAKTNLFDFQSSTELAFF